MHTQCAENMFEWKVCPTFKYISSVSINLPGCVSLTCEEVWDCLCVCWCRRRCPVTKYRRCYSPLTCTSYDKACLTVFASSADMSIPDQDLANRLAVLAPQVSQAQSSGVTSCFGIKCHLLKLACCKLSCFVYVNYKCNATFAGQAFYELSCCVQISIPQGEKLK